MEGREVKRTPLAVLNKEKSIFILLALIFSAGVYLFFASQPAALQSGQPLGSIASPAGVRIAAISDTGMERDYLRGKRNNPFNDPYRNRLPEPPEEPGIKKNDPKIPPPPPYPTQVVEGGSHKELFDPRDAGREYIGVVLVDGKSCALLRTRDNSAPQRLLLGEKISGLDISVTKIELQGVWLSDGTSTSVLRNERFATPPPKATPAQKDSRPSVFF